VSWMEARTPRPPADLDARLRDHVAGSVQENEVAERLLGAAEDALTAALGRPGRVRTAAFDLLAADALVTYACESALEGDEPDEVLDRLVSIGSAP